MADPSVQGGLFSLRSFFPAWSLYDRLLFSVYKVYKYMTLFNCGIIYGRVWAASHLYLNTRPQDFAIIIG